MEGAKKEDVQESTNQEKVQDSTNQEKAHDSTNQEKAHDSTNEKPTAAQNSDDSNKPKESPAKGKIDKPEIVTFANISRASIEIKDLIKCTPCTKATMSAELGMELYLKQDILQVTGAFKERGAACALLRLTKEKKKRGVIAASAGNHALGLSYHGNQLGIPVTVVCPLNAPLSKVNRCKKFKATVIQYGETFNEAFEHAQKLAEEKNLVYVNGFNDPDVIAGVGSMGMEIVEEVKGVDAILVPTGGGGLMAGVSIAAKKLYPDIKLIGVEAEACPGMTKALEAGKPVFVVPKPSLADGLGVSIVGSNAFENCKDKIDQMVTVPEDLIALAILRLLEHEKVVCEGAGAVGLAAILSGKLNHLKGKKVVILLCGGNIDITVLGRCIDRGLAAEGRLVKITVQTPDQPGGMSSVVNIISELGGSIKDVHQERAWVTTSAFQVQTTFVVEVNDKGHGQSIVKAIEKLQEIISHTLK